MYQAIYVEQGGDSPDGWATPAMVYLWDDKTGPISFPYHKDFYYAYKLDPAGSRTTLFGQSCKRVKKWEKGESGILESDLPKETRVLTDLYLDSDDPSEGHRLVVLDIEVSSVGGFCDVMEGDKEVTSIALEDRTTGTEYVFILDEHDALSDHDEPGVVVITCYSEEDLLDSFLSKWEEIAPTIVTGWNIAWFDIPYLYRRITNVAGPDQANRLSSIQRVKFSEMRRQFQIAGVNVLDYLDLYKKFTYTQQPNYRLDTIAKLELGEGKVQYDGTLDDLRANDPAKYLVYNLNDIRLVSKLDKKLKLIELVRGIAHVGHVGYEDYTWSSRWIEGALITDLHRRKIVAPNKALDAREAMAKRDDEDDEGFVGAFVKEPRPGLYEWVFSLDLQSLYPSIMMTLNISPETKQGKVLNWNVEKHVRNQLTEYEVQPTDNPSVTLTKSEFGKFMEEGKFQISSNGVLYSTDQVGLLGGMLDRWFAKRLEFKKKMKEAVKAKNDTEAEFWDRRQHIQKIYLNATYGVTGLPVFRFYDVDNAAAVTTTGQDIIKTTGRFIQKWYEEKGAGPADHIIYQDTDSCYVSTVPILPSDLTTDEQKKIFTADTARQLETKLNEWYPSMARHLFYVREKNRFIIKAEAVSKTAFWVGKKRYALSKVYDLDVNQDMAKMTVKGMDVVRSSFPAAFQKFMKEVLTDILAQKPQAEMDAKVLAFKAQLPNMPILAIARNTAVKDIAKWEQVETESQFGEATARALGQFASGTPAHVKAALTYNMLLKHFDVHHMHRPITNGQKIKWVYLKENPLKVETVGFFGDETDAPPIVQLVRDYIDYDRIFEQEFANKLSDFYAALRWGLIPTKVNQNAAKFFSF